MVPMELASSFAPAAPMRKESLYGVPRAEALAFFATQKTVRFAGTRDDGRPFVRAMNFAAVGEPLREQLYVHGAPAGEKMHGLGREVVVAVDETIAQVPSWFVDPERACPATTYYRSVQAHGVLERVDDPREKAAALAALLVKHQPEGKHVPIDADHPLYRRAIEGLLVARVSLEHLRGKMKLGQNRNAEERGNIVIGLWRRGEPGDARACAIVLAANPDTVRREIFRAPIPELTVVPHFEEEEDARQVAELLAEEYWNQGRFDRDALARAHRGSPAWVGMRDAEGRIVASARATGDGAKHAWIYDVVVAPLLRGRRVGEALLRLVLDHPAVRHAKYVHLATRDAQSFYTRLGFRDARELPPRPYTSTTMTLERA